MVDPPGLAAFTGRAPERYLTPVIHITPIRRNISYFRFRSFSPIRVPWTKPDILKTLSKIFIQKSSKEFLMVDPPGLEPGTYRLRGECSTN